MVEPKRCFLDIETTGLSPQEGAVILSIGMIMDREEDGVEFVITPSAEEWAKASPEALKVNGFTFEFLKENGQPIDDVKMGFMKWLLDNELQKGKAVIVGQNIQFDIKFLQYYLYAELAWVGAPLEDTVNNIDLFKQLQRKDQSLKGARWNTHGMSQALGVPEEPSVHNALEGAKAAQRNYWEMMRRFNGK